MNETVVAVLKARHLWLSKPARTTVVFYSTHLQVLLFVMSCLHIHTLQRSRHPKILKSLKISQTPRWRLAHHVKLFQVSGTSRYIYPVRRAPKPDAIFICKMVVFVDEVEHGSETWYTFTFLGQTLFGVWKMRPPKI